MIDNQDLKSLLDDVLNHQSTMTNESQYKVLPKQREFLIRLQGLQNQPDYTSMEQLCIAHCIKFDHYSNMHKDTLNNLIKKYSKL